MFETQTVIADFSGALSELMHCLQIFGIKNRKVLIFFPLSLNLFVELLHLNSLRLERTS